MPFLKGEDVQMGVAVEGTRGTFTSPESFIPLRTPTGLQPITEDVQIEEAVGSGVDSQGREVVQKRAEGDIEFNVRNTTITYILYSLLGSISSSLYNSETNVYEHVLTYLTDNPQHPSLSYALSQGGSSNSFQDYQYTNGAVQSFEMTIPVDDVVNATATIMAVDESTASDFSPSIAGDDYLFNHYDVVVE